MIDSMAGPYVLTVEVESPLVLDAMYKPLEVTVEVEPDTLPLFRPSKQDARFPVPLIQVNPEVLPIEAQITIHPTLTGGFVVS